MKSMLDMKLALLCLLAVLGWLNPIHAARAATEEAAAQEDRKQMDFSWKRIQDLIGAGTGMWVLRGSNRGIYTQETSEICSRMLREEGLKFYDAYPRDPRRLAWLPYAVAFKPSYQTNIVEVARAKAEAKKGGASQSTNAAPLPDAKYDEDAKAAWEKRYPQLRTEFAASASAMPMEDAILRIAEIHAAIRSATSSEAGNTFYENGEAGQKMRAEFRRELLGIGKLPVDWSRMNIGDPSYNLRFLADRVLSASWTAGDGAPEFIEAIKASPNPQLRDLGAARTRLAELSKTPMKARFTALDGQEIDFDRLRGKVVLVQYWASGCAGCIGQLPKIQKVYEKYRDQGFEVIGFSFDKETKLVTDLFKRLAGRNIHVSWPQRVDHTLRQAYKTYDFVWVSNLLLLDKQGLLVMHASSVSEENLEAMVRKYLGLPPALAQN